VFQHQEKAFFTHCEREEAYKFEPAIMHVNLPTPRSKVRPAGTPALAMTEHINLRRAVSRRTRLSRMCVCVSEKINPRAASALRVEKERV
jgi:hypothetical protein